jgi:hypothetical protein
MRSGDEPGHARSPLRLRFGLALFGLVFGLVAAVVVAAEVSIGAGLVFLALALLAAVDLVLIGRRIRQGAHFQPGPSIPPYRPAEATPVRSAPRPPVTERTRMRRYLAIMIICLVLIALAWFWVRFYSTTAAVAMSMVAAVLPPIAVIVANFGVQLPDLPDDPSSGTTGEQRRPPVAPPSQPFQSFGPASNPASKRPDHETRPSGSSGVPGLPGPRKGESSDGAQR